MKKNKLIKLATIALVSTIVLSGCGSSSSSSSSSSSVNGMSLKESYKSASKTESSSRADVEDIDAIYSDISASLDSGSYRQNIGEAVGNILTPSSGGSNESYAQREEKFDPEKPDIDTSKSEMTLLQEKLVYRGEVELETLEYENTLDLIINKINELGGIIQHRSETDQASSWYYNDYEKTSGTLHCYLQIRIPSKNYDAFMNSLDSSETSRVRNKKHSVENISQKYYDNETRISVLEKEQERLLDMMDRANDISEMITVEDRLSEVDAELALLKTERVYMDIDVAYSYVDLTIDEVLEYTKQDVNKKKNTFFDRLGNTIVESKDTLLAGLEAILFLIIRLLPWILLVAVVRLIYVKLFAKKLREHKKKKREAKGDLSIDEMGMILNNLNQQVQNKQNNWHVTNMQNENREYSEDSKNSDNSENNRHDADSDSNEEQ